MQLQTLFTPGLCNAWATKWICDCHKVSLRVPELTVFPVLLLASDSGKEKTFRWIFNGLVSQSFEFFILIILRCHRSTAKQGRPCRQSKSPLRKNLDEHVDTLNFQKRIFYCLHDSKISVSWKQSRLYLLYIYTSILIFEFILFFFSTLVPANAAMTLSLGTCVSVIITIFWYSWRWECCFPMWGSLS